LTKKRASPRVKDAVGTRRRLLEAAFSEIHACGFRSASVDRMLQAAGLTKGALYHHFESKQALGQAVVSELLGGWIRQFAATLAQAADPIAALREWVEAPPWAPVRMGCPLNNLAQEMAAVDEAFRERIEEVFAAWRGAIADALRGGQKAGQVRPDLDAAQVAGFILAALEGSISLAKSARDEALFQSNMKLLSGFIEGLRRPSVKE
jgi:AcrR family transcriptional regulator